MSTGLSAADVGRTQDAMDTIVRPQAFPDFDHWRRAVLGVVKALLGADRGGFLVGRPRGHDWVSDYPPVRISDYEARITDLAPDVDVFARHAALGVHSRDEAWLPLRPDFYATAYYNDYLRPLRAFDALGVTWFRGGRPGRDRVCQFLVHHASDEGPRFGDRERTMLRLLRPALISGAERALAVGTDLETVFDSIDAPVVVVDESGGALFVNQAARWLLARHPGLQARVSAEVEQRIRGGETRPLHGTLDVHGRSIGFTLTRSALPGAVKTGFVMTLRAPAASVQAAEENAERLGLTPRQVEVAILLARGRSNKAIARALCIQPKTARRHTENVLRRLELSSRAEVASALLARGVGFHE